MDPNRTDYSLLWKGRQSGPFSLAAIRERLTAGEINRMHQINVEGRWLVLGDFLEQQDGGPAEIRRRVEAAQRQTQAAQREEQLRHEYESQLAAERAQQGALQERLTEAEKRAPRSPLVPAPLPPDAPPPPPQYLRPRQPPTEAPQAPSYAPVRSVTPPPPGYTSSAFPEFSEVSRSAAEPGRKNGLALAAFVASLCNVIPGVNLVTWIVALVLGHIALWQTDQDPTLGGRRLAIAALIITYSLLALTLIVFLVASIFFGFNLNRFLHRS